MMVLSVLNCVTGGPLALPNLDGRAVTEAQPNAADSTLTNPCIDVRRILKIPAHLIDKVERFCGTWPAGVRGIALPAAGHTEGFSSSDSGAEFGSTAVHPDRTDCLSHRRNKGLLYTVGPTPRIVHRLVNPTFFNSSHDDGIPSCVLRELLILSAILPDHPNVVKLKSFDVVSKDDPSVRDDPSVSTGGSRDGGGRDGVRLSHQWAILSSFVFAEESLASIIYRRVSESRSDDHSASPSDMGVNPPTKRVFSDRIRSNFHSWLSQAACGLSALHQHGVAHRNIRPENILVDSSNTVKITDLMHACVCPIGTSNAYLSDQGEDTHDGPSGCPLTPREPRHRPQSERELSRITYTAPEMLNRSVARSIGALLTYEDCESCRDHHLSQMTYRPIHADERVYDPFALDVWAFGVVASEVMQAAHERIPPVPWAEVRTETEVSILQAFRLKSFLRTMDETIAQLRNEVTRIRGADSSETREFATQDCFDTRRIHQLQLCATAVRSCLLTCPRIRLKMNSVCDFLRRGRFGSHQGSLASHEGRLNISIDSSSIYLSHGSFVSPFEFPNVRPVHKDLAFQWTGYMLRLAWEALESRNPSAVLHYASAILADALTKKEFAGLDFGGAASAGSVLSSQANPSFPVFGSTPRRVSDTACSALHLVTACVKTAHRLTHSMDGYKLATSVEIGEFLDHGGKYSASSVIAAERLLVSSGALFAAADMTVHDLVVASCEPSVARTAGFISDCVCFVGNFRTDVVRLSAAIVALAYLWQASWLPSGASGAALSSSSEVSDSDVVIASTLVTCVAQSVRTVLRDRDMSELLCMVHYGQYSFTFGSLMHLTPSRSEIFAALDAVLKTYRLRFPRQSLASPVVSGAWVRMESDVSPRGPENEPSNAIQGKQASPVRMDDALTYNASPILRSRPRMSSASSRKNRRGAARVHLSEESGTEIGWPEEWLDPSITAEALLCSYSDFSPLAKRINREEINN